MTIFELEDFVATEYCGYHCRCREIASSYTCVKQHATACVDLQPPRRVVRYTEPHTLLHADAKTLPGISDPFPDLFDPANLLARADGSVRPVQEVKRWREAEVTHGRVSMLAALVRTLLINAAAGSLNGSREEQHCHCHLLPQLKKCVAARHIGISTALCSTC